jgi:hypothetical protein
VAGSVMHVKCMHVKYIHDLCSLLGNILSYFDSFMRT